ncbi:MAG: hypothetical protein KAT15_30885, partial [Bacteroidales bacterium]|nr:hypothetical protein [Bacteroidales bacterium]
SPGNGASRIVRSPGISIKDSLKGTSRPVVNEIESALDEEPPEASLNDLKPADPDAILHAWNDYALSLEKKKPRIYSTLTSNLPEVRGDGAVRVRLNSEAQKDNFIKNIKSDLADYIQNKTGLARVEIITEVAENMQSEKKIYTEQDKLDFLINKNPELGTLKSRFNLDFDD